MKIYEEYAHNMADVLLKNRKLYSEIYAILNAPEIKLLRGNARLIKKQIKEKLISKGWVVDPVVHNDFNLRINAMKESSGLMVQTGNITRAFYDLLKFQVMKDNNRIETCTLIVPTKGAAKVLGDNIADFTRISNEFKLFGRIINVPCLVLGFDE